MKKNIGNLDRTLRIIAGLVLVALVFVGPQTPWGWVGLIMIATGLLRFCPFYAPFKIDTNKAN